MDTPITSTLTKPCTAFQGSRLLASGTLIDVALAVKAASVPEQVEPILTFDDATGKVIDLDLRGSTADIVARLAAHTESSFGAEEGAAPSATRSRGRPKLGVVAREVTLLPRHWAWLASQRGGASQALRRLVEEARRTDAGRTHTRVAQERAYRFLSAMAGDLPGFEEATRALFAADRNRFAECTAAWPEDLRQYACRLAWGIADGPSPETAV